MKACELQRPMRRMLLFPRNVTLSLHTPKQTTVEANSTLDGVACNQIDHSCIKDFVHRLESYNREQVSWKGRPTSPFPKVTVSRTFG